ncbi:MAG TPA: F0F1 ATP synthase subunit A, partial [Chthoniobacterales bacterium]|nr:F0F1 ATP synthase subunit A [Chthoniobacterales bacterium]
MIGLLHCHFNRMLHRFSFLPIVALGIFGFGAIAPEVAAAEPAQEHATAKEEHEAISLKPAILFQVGKFAVTNSMLVTWIVAVGIILAAQTATRNIKPVPSGAQNFWEWLVESLYNFLESVIGSELVRKTFWFFATIFI